MKVNVVILVLVIALAVVMLRGTEAEKYRVGGNLGWTIPPGGAATYASWASKYTFKVDKDLIALAAAMLSATEARKYRVGGDLGWTIPPSGAATYASWASKVRLQSRRNDVIVVTKENFDICNTTKPLYQYKGPVFLRAAISGTYYLTCSFAGHCTKGQKVAIYFAL
ncbi:early nodulin-like protein 14 [Rosa rugosa]|uniref:early nodulin-like protein 14 n=1 Tax=Rosa rugosa TaxID=74645 RepID=UPI002B413C6C|nr:early nodulin-like protein 14 [Rosa rugosa]